MDIMLQLKNKTSYIIQYNIFDISYQKSVLSSYNPIGRSLLLLELLDKVFISGIILSSCIIVQRLDVIGCFNFFAGDGPGSVSPVLHWLAAVSLCFLGT